MANSNYQIETLNYQNFCYRLSETFLFFRRIHHRENSQIEADVFADFWSLAFLPRGSQPLKTIVNDKETQFDGPVCFFIPAHSIVRWQLPAGVLTWQALISTKKIGSPFVEPMALAADIRLDEVTSEETVEAWLKLAKPLGKIGVALSHSVIAEKTKLWIDEHFQSETKISDIASTLGVSNAYVTKEFKKSFGMSPLEYRNKKRIYKAMQLYMFQNNIANKVVAHEVGFNEYSRFTKNFHHMMNASPSEFKALDV